MRSQRSDIPGLRWTLSLRELKPVNLSFTADGAVELNWFSLHFVIALPCFRVKSQIWGRFEKMYSLCYDDRHVVSGMWVLRHSSVCCPIPSRIERHFIS